MTWFGSMFTGVTGSGDSISASTMNITKIVSIITTLAAGITTGLGGTDTGITLSSGQIVAIWLTAAVLVVALSITDMVCRAYVTAKKYGLGGEAPLTDLGIKVVDVREEPPAHGHREAELVGVVAGATPPLAHVRFKDVQNQNGIKTHDEYVELIRVKEHA